jgi:hypothetical protein
LKRSEIDRRLAAGEPTAQVARDYQLNPSSLHRHRVNCLKLGSASAIKKEVARGTAAITLLPSKETLSGHYSDLCARIDQIVARAQAEGSLAIAVSGLNSLRQTIDSLARLAGHIGGGAQVKVAIQNNINVDARRIADRLIIQFDKEPELKARIAQALLRLDDIGKSIAAGMKRAGGRRAVSIHLPWRAHCGLKLISLNQESSRATRGS